MPATEELSAAAVRGLQHGDVAALEALWKVHGDRLFNLVRRMVGNHADAEDLAQDVLLKVLEQARKFHGRSRFSTWLFRLTVNQTLNFLERRRRGAGAPLADLDPTFGLEDPLHPERVAQRAEERELIDRALQALPVDQRTVLVLREIDGMSYAEISSVLRVREGTVTSRLVRARRRMRRLLAKLAPHRFSMDGPDGSECRNL